VAQDLSDFKKLEEFLTLAKTIDVFKSCQDIFDVFGIKDKNASLYDIQIQIDSFVSKWSGSNAPKYVILGRRVEGDAEVFKRVLKEKRPAYNDYLFENHPKIKELQIHFKAYTKDGELDEIEKQNLIDEAVSSDLPEGKFLLLIERWLLEAGVREVQSSSTASSATTTSEFDLFLKLTCYEQLGVSEKADYAAIKDAFEKAYSRYNGLGASKKGIESAKFERMQAAYEILKDPRKRRDYDELLAQGPPPIEGDPILKVERKSNLEYTFKNIRKGTDLKETIAIKNPGGGLLQGSIRSDVPWIEPDRDKILKQHEQNLVIRILTSKIPAKVYKASGFVTIETNAPIAGKHEIPITVFLENYEIELQRFQKTYIPLVISFFGLIGSFFGLLKLIIFAGASGGISFFLSKLVLDHCQNKGIDLSKYPAALAHSLTCGMVALTFIINGNSLFNQGSPIPSQPKTSFPSPQLNTSTPTNDLPPPLAENTTTISVLVSGECRCGSHGGSLDATYDGKKVSIDFYHNPTPANPVEHPIIVLKNNELVEGWDSLLCSIGSDICPIVGYKVAALGRWTNSESFDAYKIWIK